jgi:hypothetical protein
LKAVAFYFRARMSGNSIQDRIQMRIMRVNRYEQQKERALKYFDNQIESMSIKINKMKETVDQFSDQKTLTELSWNDRIKTLKLQIQKLQNS